MHIFFYVIAGIAFIYWLWGMSQPDHNRPKVFWHTTGFGVYNVLIVSTVLTLIGYLLSG